MPIFYPVSLKSHKDYCEDQKFLHLCNSTYKIITLIGISSIIWYCSLFVNILLSFTTVCLLLFSTSIDSLISKELSKFLISLCTFFLTCSFSRRNIAYYHNINPNKSTIVYEFSSQVVTIFSITTAVKVALGLLLSLILPSLLITTTNPESFALTLNQQKKLISKVIYIIFPFILAFELIPIILDDFNNIRVAFKVRGLNSFRKRPGFFLNV
nr:Energy-coupling factor transporter transmembrane protein EcfT-like [Cavernulicola chilensis]